MKRTLNTLLGAILLAGGASAFAASSVDLTVTGVITPSACTPTLSSGGIVDYGKISVRDLQPDRPTFLPEQTVQLMFTCDATTLAALEAKDNREGSDFNNNTSAFGLGLINGNEKLGAMTLSLLSPVADGVPVKTIASEDGGSTWFADRFLTRTNILSVADTSDVTPIPVQQFTSDLRIAPLIAPTNGLTLTNEVSIDGSVTVTVRYL